MTTANNTRNVSGTPVAIRTILIVAALTCGAHYVAAAPVEAVSAPANAVSKAERVISDTWITTKVKSEILENSVSKGFHVSVKTQHGNVKLTGKLPNQDGVDLVKMIAEQVKGVKSVDVSGLKIGA